MNSNRIYKTDNHKKTDNPFNKQNSHCLNSVEIIKYHKNFESLNLNTNQNNFVNHNFNFDLDDNNIENEENCDPNRPNHNNNKSTYIKRLMELHCKMISELKLEFKLVEEKILKLHKTVDGFELDYYEQLLSNSKQMLSASNNPNILRLCKEMLNQEDQDIQKRAKHILLKDHSEICLMSPV